MHTRAELFPVAAENLSPLAADPPGQLNVLRHDGHALGVDGAKVGVLEQTHQVCFRGLLKGKHRVALETQIGLHKYNRRMRNLQNCGIKTEHTITV